MLVPNDYRLAVAGRRRHAALPQLPLDAVIAEYGVEAIRQLTLSGISRPDC